MVSLPDLEALPPEHRAILEELRARLGFYPNAMRALALSPRFPLWFRHYQALMQGEGALSRAEREAIAIAVSSANRCEYCTVTHKRYFLDLTQDKALAEALAANPWGVAAGRHPEAPPRLRALLRLALGLTEASHRLEGGWEGLTREEALEALEVAAMFNYTNRLLNALGVRPNPEYYG
jgi:uncharacterized peroxidase-related enzyme